MGPSQQTRAWQLWLQQILSTYIASNYISLFKLHGQKRRSCCNSSIFKDTIGIMSDSLFHPHNYLRYYQRVRNSGPQCPDMRVRLH